MSTRQTYNEVVFQELALLKDITRTATISCRETCELLVVDKEVFSQICPRIFDIELEAKVRFLRYTSYSRYFCCAQLYNSILNLKQYAPYLYLFLFCVLFTAILPSFTRSIGNTNPFITFVSIHTFKKYVLQVYICYLYVIHILQVLKRHAPD